ncbi:MaoC family dehydratase N-terminal domain-containing protein [Chloroflexota bacterium]
MAEESIITEEMRSMVGIESKPSVYEIQSEPIRRWAEAIGDDNSLYHDEEYARKSRFGAMIVPPAMIGSYMYPVKSGGPPPKVKSPFWRSLNGGNEYEFYQPIRAGDVLTATAKIVDLQERQGRPGIGRMLIQIRETTYKNQHGELVAKRLNSGITYEGPTEKKGD